MKKKVLAALMAMLMVIGVVGCGSDSGTSASSMPPETRPTESSVIESEEEITDEYGRIYDAELGIYVYPSTESEKEESTSTPGSDRTGARPGADAGTEDESMAQNVNEISGLIIANISLGLTTADCSTCEILSFNPINGEIRTVSNFQIQGNSECDYMFAVPNGYFSGSYHFNESYTKMAVNKTIIANFETHAGWVTNDGAFFDVTEAVGMASQGGFVDAVKHQSLGFTDNGLFVFCDNSNQQNPRCYSVPIDDVSQDTVTEGFVAPYSAHIIDYVDCISLYDVVSDWIDATHCIMTLRNGNPTTSVIFDTETGSKTEYIPGNSRKNWHGRLSPDGTQVAFVSTLLTGMESPDIFIISVNGGEPERVVSHSFVITDTNVDFDLYSLSSGKNCCTLIDWR